MRSASAASAGGAYLRRAVLRGDRAAGHDVDAVDARLTDPVRAGVGAPGPGGLEAVIRNQDDDIVFAQLVERIFEMVLYVV